MPPKNKSHLLKAEEQIHRLSFILALFFDWEFPCFFTQRRQLLKYLSPWLPY
jgi:hypothetical protein